MERGLWKMEGSKQTEGIRKNLTFSLRFATLLQEC
jgi:hypothetical protein